MIHHKDWLNLKFVTSIRELERIAQAHLIGQVSLRLDESIFSGADQSAAASVNKMLDHQMDILRQIMTTMMAYKCNAPLSVIVSTRTSQTMVVHSNHITNCNHG